MSLHLTGEPENNYFTSHGSIPTAGFRITGTGHAGKKEVVLSAAEVLRRQKEQDAYIASLKRDGLDPEAMSAARSRAMTKLRADFDAINAKLLQQKKDPFVIRNIRRVLDADFQAAVKKAGFSLRLDTTGWTDKAGRPVWNRLDNSKDADDDTPVVSKSVWIGAEFANAISHVSRLQYGLLRQRASLNLFLFTGPGEKTEQAENDLSSLAAKNGGKFSLISTKRLEELAQTTPSSP